MSNSQQTYVLISGAGKFLRNIEIESTSKHVAKIVGSTEERNDKLCPLQRDMEALRLRLSEKERLICNLSKKVEKLEEALKQKLDYATLANFMLDTFSSVNADAGPSVVTSCGVEHQTDIDGGSDSAGVQSLGCDRNFSSVTEASVSLNSGSPVYSDSSVTTFASSQSDSLPLEGFVPMDCSSDFRLDDYLDIEDGVNSEPVSARPVNLVTNSGISTAEPVFGIVGCQDKFGGAGNSSEVNELDGFIELINFESCQTTDPSLPGFKDTATNTDDVSKEMSNVGVQCDMPKSVSSSHSKEDVRKSRKTSVSSTNVPGHVKPIGKVDKTRSFNLPKAVVVLKDLKLGGALLFGGDHVAKLKQNSYNTRAHKWSYVPKKFS